jgi:hypothetical protein
MSARPRAAGTDADPTTALGEPRPAAARASVPSATTPEGASRAPAMAEPTAWPRPSITGPLGVRASRPLAAPPATAAAFAAPEAGPRVTGEAPPLAAPAPPQPDPRWSHAEIWAPPPVAAAGPAPIWPLVLAFLVSAGVGLVITVVVARLF